MSAVRDDKQHVTGIRCDGPECETVAPDAKTIAQGGGLINMGWWCKGGKHMCPTHHPDT